MGSVDIASKLKYESDMGVDLTRKHGYVFNVNNYQQAATPADKKKFVEVSGYVLADVISRTEVQSECTCVLSCGLYAETRCKATEQRLLPPVSFSIRIIEKFCLPFFFFPFFRVHPRKHPKDVKHSHNSNKLRIMFARTEIPF